MLVAYSDSDPIARPMGAIFASQMRGAAVIDHPVVRGAGHFLQTRSSSTATGSSVGQQDTLIAKVPEVRKLGLWVLKPSAVPVTS
jgi:hypothetical protein